MLDPALCGGWNIPRQLAAGSAAATLIIPSTISAIGLHLSYQWPIVLQDIELYLMFVLCLRSGKKFADSNRSTYGNHDVTLTLVSLWISINLLYLNDFLLFNVIWDQWLFIIRFLSL